MLRRYVGAISRFIDVPLKAVVGDGISRILRASTSPVCDSCVGCSPIAHGSCRSCTPAACGWGVRYPQRRCSLFFHHLCSGSRCCLRWRVSSTCRSACWRVRSFQRQPDPPAPALLPTVSVLKPVKGFDPGLLDAFRSHCGQVYGGRFELLIGCGGPAEELAALQGYGHTASSRVSQRPRAHRAMPAASRHKRQGRHAGADGATCRWATCWSSTMQTSA